MAVKKDKHRTAIKKLKKQVSTLTKKEGQTKNKLNSALKKIRKLSRTYKSKLVSKAKQWKAKIADAQAATYAKAAVHLERQLLKGIDAKSRALESAIAKVEKKHVGKIKKSLTKKGRKGKKTGKAKKVTNQAAKKSHKGAKRSKRVKRTHSRKRR